MKEKESNVGTTIRGILSDAKLSRRSFVKASAVTGTAMGLGVGWKPTFRALAQASAPRSEAMGQWMPATCQGCTSWCSKQVYVVDGRAVKIRGNPHSVYQIPLVPIQLFLRPWDFLHFSQ